MREKMDALESKNRKSSTVSVNCDNKEEQSDLGLKGDYTNLCVLLLLYVLQGVPLGLLSTIPMILSTNKVPYDKQAIFSFAGYPYGLKLLWAPIVDSVYSKRFGRRKSWLIPAQYSIGASLLIISPFTDDLIGSKTSPPQIYLLAFSMFIIVFLTATQDIAVDAWGLTLLSKRNVHYVASCNAVGLVLGSFTSGTLFLALESAEFCNRWFRSVPKEVGIVNIQQFFFAIGLLFVISTTIIWIFKREENVIDLNREIEGPLKTYKYLFQLIKLKSVIWLAVLYLTQYIGHAVFNAATQLKLIQFGVRREILSLLHTPIAFLNLFLPFIIVHKTKKNPMHSYWYFGVARQLFLITSILLMYWTETFNNPKNGFPIYYYAVMFVLCLIGDIIGYTSGMALYGYMMTIADPVNGGTCMTLFMTLHNIGFKWSKTAALALLDPLTFTRKWSEYQNSTLLCNNNTISSNFSITELSSVIDEYNCTTLNTTENRVLVNRTETIVDGYYVEGILCIILGLIWFACFKKQLWRMQSWPESKWRVKQEIKVNEQEKNEEVVKLTNTKVSTHEEN